MNIQKVDLNFYILFSNLPIEQLMNFLAQLYISNQFNKKQWEYILVYPFDKNRIFIS